MIFKRSTQKFLYEQLSLLWERFEQSNQKIIKLIQKQEKLEQDREAVAVEFHKRVDPSFLLDENIKFIPDFNYSSDDKKSKCIEQLFNKMGSDKSSRHKYQFFYSYLFSKIAKAGTLLEIGVGSKSHSVPSHMGKEFKTGASLYVWKFLLPDWRVVGIDIDENCLLAIQNGIEIYVVDQSLHNQLREFIESKNMRELDLIIDDGFHEPYVNFSTFRILAPSLKIGGNYLIEDVPDEHLIVWAFLVKNFWNQYSFNVVRPKRGEVCSFDSNIIYIQKIV